MKARVPLFLLAVVCCACEPRLGKQLELEDWPLVAATPTKVDARRLLIVRPESTKGCCQGIGVAIVEMDSSTVLGVAAKRTRRVPCSGILFLDPSRLRELLDDEGFFPGKKLERSQPCLRSPGECGARFEDATGSWYINYNETDVQVVLVTYGNRSGAEATHTYRVDGDGCIESMQQALWEVRYDGLPEWW